ncbi:hypothetical protein [Pseudoleptotrichia goodfellowii]|uniref:Uncharacterized protein n=1 Tax=Pseudoleptotrichia goodfellowii TaxID=157692 RepID=A0A510JC33_9FUSO|nr:hypothetical protein [Pseudoleptotrichia goodfellowii]BBM36001.1 hypothetical protein JCM16774_0933 [Pseudoleptotrichia goodfellowii]
MKKLFQILIIILTIYVLLIGFLNNYSTKRKISEGKLEYPGRIK